MFGPNRGKGLFGPFFSETETYNGFHQPQENKPKDDVWRNEKKVHAMKSIWDGPVLEDTRGDRRHVLASGMETEEAMSYSRSDSEFSLPSSRHPSAVSHPKFLSCPVVADPHTDDMLSKMFPKVGSPPRVGESKLSKPSCIYGREEKEEFEFDFGGLTSNDAWGIDAVPFGRTVSVLSEHSVDDMFDFLPKPKAAGARKFSLDSLGSDGMSNLSSNMATGSEAGSELTLSRSDMDTLSSFLQEEEDISTRFGRTCNVNSMINKPRPGTTRADLEEFSRKFGYAGQPRASLMYRPRKGKYRKEFL